MAKQNSDKPNVMPEDKVSSWTEASPISAAPEVEVHGFKDLNNTIVIKLTRGLGDTTIKSGALNNFFDAKWSKYLNEKGEIEISGIPVKHFRVYKTTTKPKSFLEFEDYKEVSEKDGIYLDETLKTNQVYYYTARSMGEWGNILSPFSPIFKVEIIEEAGTFFPLVETIQLGEEPKRKKQITFRKKLRIQPSFLQSAPNKTTKDLGFVASGETVFSDDPEFKIRLTSRKTKRKIDLNIRFVKTKDPTGKGEIILAWEPSSQ